MDFNIPLALFGVTFDKTTACCNWPAAEIIIRCLNFSTTKLRTREVSTLYLLLIATLKELFKPRVCNLFAGGLISTA